MKNAVAIGIGLNGTSTSVGSGTPAVRNIVTPLDVKGGLERVIDSATGDIARTTSGWIEDEKYGVFALAKANAMSAEFDSSVTRTGKFTLKLSTTDVTGRAYAAINYPKEPGSTETVSSLTKYAIRIKPSTTYRINCYIKTNNVANLSARVGVRFYDSSGTRNDAISGITSTLSGTNDFSLVTKTVTSGASDAFLVLFPMLEVAGNVSDAWFDVNSMTLEEVSTITNSGSSPALLYPKFTAVSSTDNIDQSQVTSDDSTSFGSLTRVWAGQMFVPTKKNLTGFVMRRGTDTGTYTGDVTISIQADNSSSPSGTDLGTPLVLTNAQWESITADTDYTVSYPLTLDTTKNYWIVAKSSTSDDSNYTRIRLSSTKLYTSGLLKYYGVSWGSAQTKSFYFKTLYSKNTTNFTVRTDTEILSVTAPTTDGWTNGTIIDTADGTYGVTPLTLAAGDNDIYVSSNGAATADSETDPSHQAVFSGVFFN